MKFGCVVAVCPGCFCREMICMPSLCPLGKVVIDASVRFGLVSEVGGGGGKQ